MDRNVSVIVFSKGRPMQLHAYLESLIRFSDVIQEKITVLCCETEGIRYDRVERSFPRVNWCVENRFEEDLRRLVDDADQYIMFGCDDVVFTAEFSLQKAADYLDTAEDVFGFSMRLGKNIAPYPTDVVCRDGIMKWNWAKAQEQHYNYPWELDCTVYRREDVRRLLCGENQAIRNPNYFEAIIDVNNRNDRIDRKYLACNEKRGCAVVITVNRVQESYQNGYDDSMMTDIYSLDKLYNDEGNSLDIEKISQMKNKTVHVDAEYFILQKARKGYSARQLRQRKWKNRISMATRFLSKCSNYIERRMYRYGCFRNKLQILDTEETLRHLQNTNKSFVRFGENEILLMQGKTVPSQKADEKLIRHLTKVLHAKDEELLVGIPHYYIYPEQKLTPYMEIKSLSVAEQRRFLFKHCRRDRNYIDSGFTQAYHLYRDYGFEEHFERVAKLFADRDVTLICGEGVPDRLQFKLLDVCRSVEYQYGPSAEAYVEYEKILKAALRIDKDRLVCVALGSTAKPLVYDLHRAGYQVWDIGHLLKDYDAYRRKMPRESADIIKFYLPD